MYIIFDGQTRANQEKIIPLYSEEIWIFNIHICMYIFKDCIAISVLRKIYFRNNIIPTSRYIFNSQYHLSFHKPSIHIKCGERCDWRGTHWLACHYRLLFVESVIFHNHIGVYNWQVDPKNVPNILIQRWDRSSSSLPQKISWKHLVLV